MIIFNTKVDAKITAKKEKVDVLDYFLQTQNPDGKWTLGGMSVREGIDPDGAGTKTYIYSKFNSPDFYEVYKLVDDQLQLRYEVFRTGGISGKGSWIRRFEEIGGKGSAPGQIWCNRYVTPGAEGIFTKLHIDKFVYDETSKSYVVDPATSLKYFPNYTKFEWANVKWGRQNKSGFKIGKTLRMISEWQQMGYTIEIYDYAKGLGMVGWRWLERISTLTPVKDDRTGRFFHCLNDVVEVVPASQDDESPVVYLYDIKTSKRIKKLETMRLTSIWRKGLGPQWYVVYRNLMKEYPLEKRDLHIVHDFTLPEWKSKPGATIKDLPYFYTHPPK
jgi:hypothetical protein